MHLLKNILKTTCLLIATTIYSELNASTVLSTTLESKKVAEKYTLKNLGTLSRNTVSFFTLKSTLDFKGLSNHNSLGSLGNAAYLKYNKGNKTYVIPYRYKVILPKFKAPTRIQP